MESIIKKLYYGDLGRDQLLCAKDPEYRNLNNKVMKVMELLEEKVPEEDYKTIVKLMELHTGSAALETADAFVSGFKYGALIMMELLKD